MYNIAIVEDEENFSSELRQYITKFTREKNISVTIACYRSIEEFILPRQKCFDIVFFDIELPGMNGMEGAKRFREYDGEAILFFVTRLAGFALKGYEVGAMDYLIKPVSFSNLYLKLERAFKKLSKKNSDFIIIRERDEVHKVAVENIYYLEVRDHIITFHTIDGILNVTGTLNIYEEQLKGHNFSRCNNCYLVNLRAVSSIKDMTITLSNGDILNISRRRKKDFTDNFMTYVGNN